MPVKFLPEYFYNLPEDQRKAALDTMQIIIDRERRKELGIA